MRTYRYKDNNGNWVKSIFPKPTKGEEELAQAIIGLILFVFLIIAMIYLFIAIKNEEANVEQVQMTAEVKQSEMRSCIEACGYEFK